MGGGGGGGNIDDIWAQLKAKTAPSQHAQKAKQLLRGAQGIIDSRSTSKSKEKQQYDLPVAPHAGRNKKTSDADPSAVPSAGIVVPAAAAAAAATPVFADYDALQTGVARDLNTLADAQGSSSNRLKALQRISGVIDTIPVEMSTGPCPSLAEAATSLLAKPLLRRFEDSSEQCRELAISAFSAMTVRTEAVLELLPYAIPVLRDRLGPASPDSKNPTESSEEIRVKLHALLGWLLDSAEMGISAYASDAVEIMEFTVEDSHAEVLLEACGCLEVLVTHLGRRLQPVSKKLAWTFTPNLTHKRARVRVATLRALRGLMHCGAHETILDLVAFRHPNLVPIKAFYGDDQKVNYFGKLITDGSVQVRVEFIRVIGDWMTTLIERTDHESRLLPYVISALTDEADLVQREAADLMERLGVQYEKEHEKDLKSTMYYMPEHFGEDLYGVGEDALPLPPPFNARPRLGARVLVKNNFNMVVNPVINEMSSWQVELRAKAAVLLRTMLVYLEENATQHVQQLCLAFISASKDDSVVRQVGECCRLVGRFVRPGEWLGVLLDRLGPAHEANVRAGAVGVLAHCLSGASQESMEEERAEGGGGDGRCAEVLEALAEPTLAGSADTALRTALCRLVELCMREKPGTWRCHAAQLAGLALRAGGGVGGGVGGAGGGAAAAMAGAAGAATTGDKVAEAMKSALDALATATGHATAAEAVASLRGELLAPLRALPPKGWRATDAAVLAACSEVPGAPTPADAAALVQLAALVAERPAAAAVRSRLLAFPFVTRLATPLADGDAVLLLGAALPPAAANPASAYARPALAAAAAALDPSVSSSAAAAAAAAEPTTARCLAAILEHDASTSLVRADAAALIGTLASRCREEDDLSASSSSAAAAAAASSLASAAHTTTSRLVARVAPALRARLDDANDAVRRAAAAALASLAPASPLAAYHAARSALQTHLIGDEAMAAAMRSVLDSARGAHPTAVHYAVERSGLASSSSSSSSSAAASTLLADFTGGKWTDADVEGLEVSLEDLLPAEEKMSVEEREAAAAEALAAALKEEEAAAAAGAAKRLASVGLDVTTTVAAAAQPAEKSANNNKETQHAEDDEENEELFDLD